MRDRSKRATGGAIDTLETRRLLAVPLMVDALAASDSLIGYVQSDGALYFLSSDYYAHTQLWVSDGSRSGTHLVRSFDHSGAVSAPLIAEVGGKVIMGVDDGVHGLELWTTDGTLAGTQLLKDINPAGATWDLEGSIATGGRRFFFADDGATGQELWITDGTTGGTRLVKDINPGIGDSKPASPGGVALANGNICFAAQSSSTGAEFWRSDGTPGGTILVKDIVSGASGSNPRLFHAVANGFVFVSYSDLYFSDGTSAGTKLLYSFDSVGISVFTTLANGKLVFTAAGQSKGTELWATDGTPIGTTLLKDLVVGPAGSDPTIVGVEATGSFVYIALGSSPGELWRTDGTTTGTYLIKALTPGISSTQIRRAYADGLLGYLSVTSSDTSGDLPTPVTQLWRTDGSADGTVELAQWASFAFSPGITQMWRSAPEDRLYFTSNTAAAGTELWTTDGTSGGTHMVEDLNPGTANGVHTLILSDIGSSQMFFGNSGYGLRLYATGTSPAPLPLVINGSEGDDIISVRASGDVIIYSVGGAETSVLAAEVSSIIINALGGADNIAVEAAFTIGVTIYGGAGNDSISGCSGDDLIYGDDGDDTILGNDGVDTIYGNFGNDVIAGGLKRDLIMAGLGNDMVTAGDGPDSVYGGDGRDLLRGGKGADYIEGRGKADTIYGGAGNDFIIGGAGADLIYGESEDDRIDASPASVFRDTVDGGLGYDLANYDADDVVSAVEGLLA